MYAKQASESGKLADRQKHKDWRAKIDEIDKNKEDYRQKLLQKPSRVKQLTPLLITLTIIIGVLILFWMFFSFQSLPSPSAPPTPPEDSSLFSNFLNLTRIRGI
jgi:cytoskeletal protein RodZ